MPTPAKDKPWYSIEQNSVHFTVLSTEHEWYRPMYSSTSGLLNIDLRFVAQVELLLLENKVSSSVLQYLPVLLVSRAMNYGIGSLRFTCSI
ncbi:hypothetical protein FNV43_RR20173 [Rhamnella rubrinervis]|uniref:Uncharacterized protein n=1 Tax=Rhamnella rubrinervis TaxID=2594499 RepID=A0A8K0DUC3_9ROSA|nr:hypothetical protein FNV43_RR20173 [Rhamnella rubrinervis]